MNKFDTDKLHASMSTFGLVHSIKNLLVMFLADLGILNNALIGCRSDNGGSPSAISIAVTPSDQTSHRMS